MPLAPIPRRRRQTLEDGARALRSLDFYVHCDLFETPAPATPMALARRVNTPWGSEKACVGFEISAEAEQLVQLRQRMARRAANRARTTTSCSTWLCGWACRRPSSAAAWKRGGIICWPRAA
ncbi:hypothetical protein ACU4GD_08305 [Cupriavidus basilensis]